MILSGDVDQCGCALVSFVILEEIMYVYVLTIHADMVDSTILGVFTNEQDAEHERTRLTVPHPNLRYTITRHSVEDSIEHD